MTTWRDDVARLKTLQDAFVRRVRELDARTRRDAVCGEWTPKEVVAHLTGWELEVTRQFEQFEDGVSDAIEHDVDRFNRESVRARQHLSWRETVDELENAQQAFYRKATSIQDDLVAAHDQFEEWVSVQIDHYRHHLEQLHEEC